MDELPQMTSVIVKSCKFFHAAPVFGFSECQRDKPINGSPHTFSPTHMIEPNDNVSTFQERLRPKDKKTLGNPGRAACDPRDICQTFGQRSFAVLRAAERNQVQFMHLNSKMSPNL